MYESSRRDRAAPVDQRLMDLAKELNARVLSNDYNLSKVAQLRGVDVININDLANALKPVVLPGRADDGPDRRRRGRSRGRAWAISKTARWLSSSTAASTLTRTSSSP